MHVGLMGEVKDGEWNDGWKAERLGYKGEGMEEGTMDGRQKG